MFVDNEDAEKHAGNAGRLVRPCDEDDILLDRHHSSWERLVGEVDYVRSWH